MPGVGAQGQENVEGHMECVWLETPKGPLGQAAVEEKATEAVLDLLRDTRVGCMVTTRRPPEEVVRRILTMGTRRTGRAHPRMHFPWFFPLPFVFFPLSLFSFFFLGVTGRRRQGSPTRTEDVGLVQAS